MESYSVQRGKISFIIHNPNPAEGTAKVLLDMFIEVNKGRVEQKMKELAEHCEQKGPMP